MNWDQIEQKWAEMTRRVRSDLATPAPLLAVAGKPVTASALGKAQTAAVETTPPLASPVNGA